MTRRRLLSLVLLSVLALLLLAGRMAFARSWLFGFLAWNLVLAWAPLGASSLLGRARGPAAVGLLVVAWLLLFPNAAYLVTDFVHLRRRAPVPLWYDVALLAAFAWAGLAVALASLEQVHAAVAGRAGPGAGWAAVVVASALAGAGIYVGRFLRWNSWDVLLRPHDVGADVAERFLAPAAHPGAWGVTVVFGSLLLAGYVAHRREELRL